MALMDLTILDEKHICRHCQTTMSCCEVPPVHVGDGLGWGAEAMFICLNDDCPIFADGWDKIEVNYGHKASFRYMELPGSTVGNTMMVGSKIAFTGSVIDPEAMRQQNERFQQEQASVAALDTCVAENDLTPVLNLILDEHARLSGRERAIELLKELNDLACIDPIRNHTFRNTSVEQKCVLAIVEILKKHYKKECPHCAELIKSQAKTCMHCQQDL
jgi:hypothetical protein